MYNIIKLTDEHISLLEKFCEDCKLAGYQNNSSIESMKFGDVYDLNEIPNFWGIIKDNRLISVSGCHHWLDKNKQPTIMRCLFRSATLPNYNYVVPGISKYHMNSLPFSIILPQQIAKGLTEGVKNFYITTSNGSHDASGKMKRTHKALELLAKLKIVTYAGDEIIYSTIQTKWELNLDNYLTALKGFHAVRTDLGFENPKEYLNLINNKYHKI